MLRKSFLALSLLTFLFNVTSNAQFQLIKDFDSGTLNSFKSDYSGILYTIGSNVIVQYDSISAGQYTGLTTLAAVDKLGNSQFITSIQTNYDNSSFFDFVTLPNGKIAFISRAANGASKVIISNGTTAGSTEVYTSTKIIDGLECIDNGLYFTYDGDPNHALMKIDLTTLAVTQVKEFGYFGMISDISKVSNTSLIFFAPDATDNNSLKLYVSDGTTTGTTPLATINTTGGVSQNTVMTQVGNKVYFFYKNPGTDCCNNLWVTDGTIAGTQNLKEFNIVFLTDFVREGKALAWDNKFYFAAVPTGGNSNNDESLWVSDGTVNGTVRLNDPADYKNVKDFTVFKGELYFTAYSNSSYSRKLYKTDGTELGTSYVGLTSSTSSSLSPYSISSDGAYLYLAADNITYGAEVFRYDGISSQCAVSDGVSGNGSSNPTDLVINGSDLFFVADLPASGKELYTTEFTSVATHIKSSDPISVIIYPNPASNQITVSSSQKIESIRLLNQMGNVLVDTKENTIALNSYSQGVYFVEVQLMNGENGFYKIIITK
ncbi:T9SS type A sorting domain-containing protein [uncultured Cytophaga sp.]|uniref:T9SS type A sorting domain-containing protein n=1 Tax=uncultured Cytophaga sp. TaxID=160238 RepID=UPI0026226774|nr:T9SS type A sorting domain-containing protein [uncultured Cytophaga sp.]